MKSCFLFIVLFVSVFSYGFTNPVSANSANKELEKHTLANSVMPRMGETYYGTITYKGLPFEIALYWDFDVEDYNMYGGIGGSVLDIAGDRHELVHVITNKAASNNYELCYIIKCNYIIYDSGTTFKNHVAFYVSYIPSSQTLSYHVLEEGTGLWFIDEI